MGSTNITWPRKYEKVYKTIYSHSDLILDARLLAVDPSSGGTSKPGYAYYEKAKLICEGELQLKGVTRNTPLAERLQILYDELSTLLPTPADITVIEMIRGNMASFALMFAVGVTMAACRSDVTFELPINIWKALAKATPEYEKTNSWDARMIAESVIALCRQYRLEQAAVEQLKGRKK